MLLEANMECTIGILAIQGAYLEHQTCLMKSVKSLKNRMKEGITVKVVEVREPENLNSLDALIIPGGESTTMGRFLERNCFGEKLKSWMKSDAKPAVWGTCAGLIMLANDLEGTKAGGQAHLGGLDVKVSRNFFGRQINSFEATVDIKTDNLALTADKKMDQTYHGVFIRAPAVSSCDSDEVEILGTVDHPQKASTPVVVAVKQSNIMATAFHPELTEDLRWHEYFLNIVLNSKFGGNQ